MSWWRDRVKASVILTLPRSGVAGIKVMRREGEGAAATAAAAGSGPREALSCPSSSLVQAFAPLRHTRDAAAAPAMPRPAGSGGDGGAGAGR